MKDYFAIWRWLPRASVGLAFSILVVLALGGVQAVSLTAKAVSQFCTGFQSEFVTIFVVAFFFITISTLGFRLACILSSALGTIARKVIDLFIRDHSASNSVLIDLVAPISDIVERTYQANSEFYMSHYALKSVGSEKLDQVDIIAAHFDKVREHAGAIRNWNLIYVQAYQESLSQDQRKIEFMEEELGQDKSLVTVLIVAIPVILIRMWALGCGLSIGTGVTLLLLGIAGMPAYVNQKRRFAQILLASYFDIFTVAPLSDYSEREGEPKL